jgi:hypothetical protein
LPVGFLQCIPHGKPPCHLLTVRSVTPARKGLTPSGNISYITLLFIPKNLYFQHFFRAFSKVCTCSCWAHTKCKLHSGVGGSPTADSRIAVQSYRTWTRSEIRYATCTNRYSAYWKRSFNDSYKVHGGLSTVRFFRSLTWFRDFLLMRWVDNAWQSFVDFLRLENRDFQREQ